MYLCGLDQGYSEGLLISNGSCGPVGLGQGTMNAVKPGRRTNKADIYVNTTYDVVTPTSARPFTKE